MWLPKKTQLLGWAESLKRSSMELPADFDERITALRAKWDQLEVKSSAVLLFILCYISRCSCQNITMFTYLCLFLNDCRVLFELCTTLMVDIPIETA